MAEPVWQWYAGKDEENYSCGPYESLEEAIQVGKEDWEDEGFFVVEATKAEFPAPNAERIISDMFENADDMFGDDYPEPQGTDAQQAQAQVELQALLNLWMVKWRETIFPIPWLFSATRNGAYIEPTPDTVVDDGDTVE